MVGIMEYYVDGKVRRGIMSNGEECWSIARGL